MFFVEVSQPSKLIRAMSSTVSLPNHSFFRAGLVLYAVNRNPCSFFRQKLTPALFESAKGREWPYEIFHEQSSKSIVA